MEKREEHKRIVRAKRRRKRKKQKISVVTIRGIIILLLLVGATYGALQLFTVAEEPTSTDIGKKITKEEREIEELVIEEATVKDEVVENVRTVKNNATSENHKTNGLAICMYHYVYDKSSPPENLNSNYMEVGALREQFQYLVDNDYYFPTWKEVRQYIDGELLLPEKSVVLTFDDASQDFLDLGIPIAKEIGVPITSFVITNYGGANIVATYDSPYVTYQSHTHDMHRAGGNIGHGGIFTAMTVENAVADLQTSIEITGNGEALAYPYGDYNDSSEQATEEAGFLCAVTTEPGRVYPGDNPLLLPRVRMLEGQSLSSFISSIE